MTYKFTPGEYLTRDGRKAVVLCDDAPGEYPLVGYTVIPEIGSTAESWLPNGCCYSGDPDDDDLVAPVTEPEQVTKWVNLDSAGNVIFSNKGPDEYTITENVAVARTRVVLTPGMFEDESTPSEWDQAIEAARNALIEWAAKPIDPRSAAGVVSALKRGKP